ncbi:MAG: hypothetical protein ACM3U1_05745 [Chloroflexota bacterium]
MIAFLWVFLSFVAAVIYRKSRTGFWGTFILSLFLSPLLPVIIGIFSPPQPPKDIVVENRPKRSLRTMPTTRAFGESEPVHPFDKGR